MKKIMPKHSVLFASALLVMIAFQNCEKDGINNRYLSIETDKQVYSVGERVKIKVTNKHNLPLSYNFCSPYNGIAPKIMKYEGGEWIACWGPIACDAYLSGLRNLEPFEVYNETLNFSFDKGIYKIKYHFIVERGGEYQTFFSNEFKFE